MNVVNDFVRALGSAYKMQNTTLETIHVTQKLMKSGCREDAFLRANTTASMMGKPMCPPMIWNAKKRDNNGGRERS